MKLVKTILLTALFCITFSQAEAQKTIIQDFYVQNLNSFAHDVIIYPNPVVGNVVNFKSQALIIKVEITNIIGKSVQVKKKSEDLYEGVSLYLENCESGIYLAKITFDDGKVLIKKLLVK